MYIEPQTNIRILKNVPLDTSYDHTIYFGSKSAQATYFQGLTKYNVTNATYQRVNKGVARVGIQSDNLYDCNYMMFQNTAFGTKWFYAYITSVEYVNNEVSEIKFEIDVMQTWHFDYEPDYCFVEREHVTNDDIGAHILPEPVDPGEYVYNTYGPVDNDIAECDVIIAIVDTDEETSGKRYDRVFGGATLYHYSINSVDAINDKLNEYLQKPDAVVAMYMFPHYLLANLTSEGQIRDNYTSNSHRVTLTGINTSLMLDGYTPHNNKLYTYPFNFCQVNNAEGSDIILRYEFCQSLTPKVDIVGCFTQPVQLILRPYGYKNIETTIQTLELSIKDYPMCSWSTDAYAAWVAQNSVPTILGMIPAGVKGGMDLAKGDPTSILGTVTGLMTSYYQASIRADLMKGSMNNGSPNVANNTQQFYYGRMSVSYDYARTIDEFFDRFGYQVNRLKKPNRNTRPHWNYVKTSGCTLTGSIPADDMKMICSLYDRGITFWKNGNEIGNYGLDNSIGVG